MKRTALVYRGPASCPGCPEALAALLADSSWSLDVRFVGDDEALPLSRGSLATSVLYAQGGGDISLRRAYRRMRSSAKAIRSYVESGGRYLGICMGAYLAGHEPGFGLLPGDSDQYITSEGASVTTTRDSVVDVDWRGERFPMFFQDGPLFHLPRKAPAEVMVLARYASNSEIAAMVAPCGRGWVGVCGPHPEAAEDWYIEHNLPLPQRSTAALGHDLVDVLLSAGR